MDCPIRLGHVNRRAGLGRGRTGGTDSSIDNVVSAVDVNGIASDKPGRIMSQERRCGAAPFSERACA